MFNKLFPIINEELTYWKEKAKNIPNPELRNQALASIDTKEFHCQGGGVFALLAGEKYKNALRFIVAYQTISDYLDNLCDRSISLDPKDFRLLHESMRDALSPGAAFKNYYAHREDQNDGGYLKDLVITCQNLLKEIEDYPVIHGKLIELESLYADLQIHKHVKIDERLPRLTEWYKENKEKALGLSWYEFAAASGSTLGIFCLVSYSFAGKMNLLLAEHIVHAYFPYVQGLHILLDYYIDQVEDREEGDLNFCSYYRDEVHMEERLSYFLIMAEEYLARLPDQYFHRFIPKGLVALYLSDKKVKTIEGSDKLKKELLRKSGFTGKILHYNIKMYYRMSN